MVEKESSETTRLLRAWADGDKRALEQLTPRVYNELRRIDITNLDWQHRAHFFAISAQIMRRILLARARRRVAARSDQGTRRTSSLTNSDGARPGTRRVLSVRRSPRPFHSRNNNTCNRNANVVVAKIDRQDLIETGG